MLNPAKGKQSPRGEESSQYTASIGYANGLAQGASGLPLQVRGGAFLALAIHNVSTEGSFPLASASVAGFRTSREVVVTDDGQFCRERVLGGLVVTVVLSFDR